MRTTAWNVSYLLYASCGIRERYLIDGDRKKMVEGSISGSTRLRTNWDPADVYPIYRTGADDGENCKEIEKTLFWIGGTGFVLYPQYITGTFYMRANLTSHTVTNTWPL